MKYFLDHLKWMRPFLVVTAILLGMVTDEVVHYYTYLDLTRYDQRVSQVVPSPAPVRTAAPLTNDQLLTQYANARCKEGDGAQDDYAVDIKFYKGYGEGFTTFDPDKLAQYSCVHPADHTTYPGEDVHL